MRFRTTTAGSGASARGSARSSGGGYEDMSHRSLEDVLERSAIQSNCCAIRRSGRMSFRWCVPSSRTGETSNVPGERRCALFDQSHHMTDLYVEGPDAIKLFSDLGVNSFKNFKVNQGQAIRRLQPRRLCDRRRDSLYLDENSFNLVGRPPLTTGCSTTLRPAATTSRRNGTSDPLVNQRPPARSIRYQVQGPNAVQVMEKVTGKAAAGHPVLQHGVAQDRRP